MMALRTVLVVAVAPWSCTGCSNRGLAQQAIHKGSGSRRVVRDAGSDSVQDSARTTSATECGGEACRQMWPRLAGPWPATRAASIRCMNLRARRRGPSVARARQIGRVRSRVAPRPAARPRRFRGGVQFRRSLHQLLSSATQCGPCSVPSVGRVDGVLSTVGGSVCVCMYE